MERALLGNLRFFKKIFSKELIFLPSSCVSIHVYMCVHTQHTYRSANVISKKVKRNSAVQISALLYFKSHSVAAHLIEF